MKHIPTAPTPGPPHLPCSKAASALNQSVTGDVRRVMREVNSREMQFFFSTRIVFPSVGFSPGTPKREGRIAVQPISATFLPNSATRGVIPGISAMTITAGPEPIRRTVLLLPLCSNSAIS